MLNEIDLEFVFSEIGAVGRTEVEALVESLGQKLQKKARLAPSLIVRSEAELFGCSVPRFAYRLYFEDQNGFINVRRLRELASNIHVYERGNALKDEPDHEVPREHLLSLLAEPKQSCIADCLLPRPPHLKPERFHLVTVLLEAAYGETLTRTRASNSPLTPFVKNITLGGGLCAQAASFISTAALHHVANGIYGLAEITALAQPQRRKTLNISGMDNRLMQRYFSSVSLSMTVQAPLPNNIQPNLHQRQQILDFETALLAYCRSDVPVILPTDYGRLLGFPNLRSGNETDTPDSIYRRNGFTPELKEFDRTKANRHSIVVLGCTKNPEPGKACFIFNDPAAHPFMDATAQQLADVGPYLHESPDRIELCRFWPVTASAVRMPLMSFLPPGSYEWRHGLEWISKWYHREHVVERLSVERAFLLKRLTDLSMLQIPDLLPQRSAISNPNQGALRDALRNVSEQLSVRYLMAPDHWVWLEITSGAIFVWDAEAEPVTDNPEEYLLAAVRQGVAGPSISWFEDF